MLQSAEPRIGAQRPRLEHLPEGAVANMAEDAVALSALTGLFLDDFQEYVLEQATGVRADGKWAAFQVGIEIARQNGKSASIEARILLGLFVLPNERRIVYSAHEFKTTVQIFNRLEKLITETPALDALVKPGGIKHGNDGRQIELIDGSIALFLARSGGSARGFTGDLVILDEAYNLNSAMIAAMLPTMAARSIDGNPQIWYVSSAGALDSDVLNGTRASALSEDAPPNMLWMEWSANEDADPEDVDAWYQANPALGLRISEEYIASELDAFRNDPARGETAWKIERLGIREAVIANTTIAKTDWTKCLDEEAVAPGVGHPVAFAVDVPPERDTAWICACWDLGGGRVFVELVDAREGTAWVPERLKELKAKFKPVSIVVDAKGGAGALIPDIKAEGVITRQISPQDLGSACARVYDLVTQHLLVHPGQTELTSAALSARSKAMGDSGMWKWDRKNPVAQIAPLIAATLALHGLAGGRKLGVARRKTGRVVVL